MTKSLRETRGEKNAAVRQRALAQRGPSGEADARAAPSERAWRECVLAGICPICGKGPYKVIAMHTTKKHAVDKRELRERAGFFYSDSICAPEHHDRMASLARARDLPEVGRQAMQPQQGRPKGPRRMTPAARAQNAEKFRRYTETVGAAAALEQRRAASRAEARRRVTIRTCRAPGCHNLILGTARANCSPECVKASIARRGFATTRP